MAHQHGEPVGVFAFSAHITNPDTAVFVRPPVAIFSAAVGAKGARTVSAAKVVARHAPCLEDVWPAAKRKVFRFFIHGFCPSKLLEGPYP